MLLCWTEFLPHKWSLLHLLSNNKKFRKKLYKKIFSQYSNCVVWQKQLLWTEIPQQTKLGQFFAVWISVESYIGQLLVSLLKKMRRNASESLNGLPWHVTYLQNFVFSFSDPEEKSKQDKHPETSSESSLRLPRLGELQLDVWDSITCLVTSRDRVRSWRPLCAAASGHH